MFFKWPLIRFCGQGMQKLVILWEQPINPTVTDQVLFEIAWRNTWRFYVLFMNSYLDGIPSTFACVLYPLAVPVAWLLIIALGTMMFSISESWLVWFPPPGCPSELLISITDLWTIFDPDFIFVFTTNFDKFLRRPRPSCRNEFNWQKLFFDFIFPKWKVRFDIFFVYSLIKSENAIGAWHFDCPSSSIQESTCAVTWTKRLNGRVPHHHIQVLHQYNFPQFLHENADYQVWTAFWSQVRAIHPYFVS